MDAKTGRWESEECKNASWSQTIPPIAGYFKEENGNLVEKSAGCHLNEEVHVSIARNGTDTMSVLIWCSKEHTRPPPRGLPET